MNCIHKLARIFYHMWTTGQPYKDQGVDFYEQKYKERVIRNMKKKAALLGFEIELKQAAEILVT